MVALLNVLPSCPRADYVCMLYVWHCMYVCMHVFCSECFRMGAPCKTDIDCANQGSGAGPATCQANHCHAAVWPAIPSGLDYISLDVYSNPTSEIAIAKSYYSRFLLPLLQPHQSVWLVPGMFGKNGTQNNPHEMATQDTELVSKLNDYFRYAAEEPRVTGLIPWHWEQEAENFQPASMRLGASSFPKTLRKWAQIRSTIPPL
jgi:hypothetical protein